MATNLKSRLTTIPLLGLLLMLTACPYETFCYTPRIERPNSIVIAPDKRTFDSGESLRITVSIPSKIDYDQDTYDINIALGVSSSSRFSNISEVLNGNTFNLYKGQLDNSQMILNYSKDNDSYEFECEITLDRKGEYRLFGISELIRFTKSEDNCEFIDVIATIKGMNQDGFYEFTVG